MKRIISAMLIFAVLLSALSITAFGAQATGTYTFSDITGTYTATLTKNTNIIVSLKYSRGGYQLSASGTARKEQNVSGNVYTVGIGISAVDSCIANKTYSATTYPGTNFQFLTADCSYKVNYNTVVNNLHVP